MKLKVFTRFFRLLAYSFIRLLAYSFIILAVVVPLVISILLYLEQDIKFNAPFLKTYLIKIIDKKIPEHNVDVSFIKVSTALKLSKIQVEIYGFDIATVTKKSSLYIDKLSIEFDLFDLITKGNMDCSIILSEIPINLARTLGNDYTVKLDSFNLFDTGLGQKVFKTNFKNIKFLQFQNPQLTILDEPSKVSIRPHIDSIDLNFSENEDSLVFQALMPQEDLKGAVVEFSAKYSHVSQSTSINTQIKNLVPSRLLSMNDPRLDFLKRIDAQISSSVDLHFNKDGTVNQYSGTLGVKDLFFEQGLRESPELKVNDISFDFVSSEDVSKVQLKHIEINSNFLISQGKGEFTFEDGLNAKLFFSEFNLVGLVNSGEKVQISNATFDVDLHPFKNQIVVKSADINQGETKLIGEGKLSFGKKLQTNDYFRLKLFDIRSDYLRHFEFKNKKFGAILLDFDKIDDLDVVLTWGVNDLLEPVYDWYATFSKVHTSSSYLGGEELLILDGDVSFDSDTMIINVNKIVPKDSKFSEFEFEFENLELAFVNMQNNPKLTLKTDFKGDFNKINNQEIELISKKIGLIADQNLLFKKHASLGVINGRFEGIFTGVDLPKLTATTMMANINLEDCSVGLTSLTKPLKISKIAIRASKQEIILEIEGSFNQRPLLSTFTKVFIKDVASTLKVLWEPDLIDLKSNFGKDITYSGSGKLVVQTDITFPPNRPTIYRFKADMTNVELSVPSLGFAKNKKESGILEFGWTASEAISFEFVSKGYELSGLVFFDLEKQLDKVEFHKVKLQEYFFGKALYSAGELENTLVINGPMYDYEKSPRNKMFLPKKKLKVIVNFTKLKVRQDLELDKFIGSFEFNDELTGSGAGRLNGGPKVAVSVTVSNNRKIFKVYSNNAGDVLLRSNVYSSGYGGEMNFELQQQLGEASKGILHIKEMRVIGGPFLAKLISLSSIEGILDLLGSNGMVFNEIKAEYSLKKDFLSIKNGIAVNPSFGITLSGTREMSKKIINYTGVLSPAYSLNGLVKKIPLIGNLIGGSEGEGVFGINYFATGALQNPRVTVNPLSIIAPGKFRKLLN